jgi:hypothetical protein
MDESCSEANKDLRKDEIFRWQIMRKREWNRGQEQAGVYQHNGWEVRHNFNAWVRSICDIVTHSGTTKYGRQGGFS